MGLHFGSPNASLELVLDHFVPSVVECAFLPLQINFFCIDDESASGFLGIPSARHGCRPSHVSYSLDGVKSAINDAAQREPLI